MTRLNLISTVGNKQSPPTDIIETKFCLGVRQISNFPWGVIGNFFNDLISAENFN
jgi:hypothetical protein